MDTLYRILYLLFKCYFVLLGENCQFLFNFLFKKKVAEYQSFLYWLTYMLVDPFIKMAIEFLKHCFLLCYQCTSPSSILNIANVQSACCPETSSQLHPLLLPQQFNCFVTLLILLLIKNLCTEFHLDFLTVEFKWNGCG